MTAAAAALIVEMVRAVPCTAIHVQVPYSFAHLHCQKVLTRQRVLGWIFSVLFFDMHLVDRVDCALVLHVQPWEHMLLHLLNLSALLDSKQVLDVAMRRVVATPLCPTTPRGFTYCILTGCCRVLETNDNEYLVRKVALPASLLCNTWCDLESPLYGVSKISMLMSQHASLMRLCAGLRGGWCGGRRGGIGLHAAHRCRAARDTTTADPRKVAGTHCVRQRTSAILIFV